MSVRGGLTAPAELTSISIPTLKALPHFAELEREVHISITRTDAIAMIWLTTGFFEVVNQGIETSR